VRSPRITCSEADIPTVLRLLPLEKLMAIEMPIPPVATQHAFDRMQAEVGDFEAKDTIIRQASAAMLERVFAGSP
jgi:type I restriction enzyme, S subunit